MNIFYFLLLLATHIFIQTDDSATNDSPNFTFTFKDESNLPTDQKNKPTIVSVFASYENNKSQTITPPNNPPINFTPNDTITITIPPVFTQSGGTSSYKRIGLQSLIFKIGSNNTTNTINFNPNLKMNGSFTLKKDGNSYSVTDIKENTPSSDEKKSDDKKDGDEKSGDEKKSDDKKDGDQKQDDKNKAPEEEKKSENTNKPDEKKDDEKKSEDKKPIIRSFGKLTIHNTSKDQNLELQNISILYSYTDTDGSTKQDTFTISSKKSVTINKNSTGTIPLNVKLDKPNLAYNGLKTISLTNNNSIQIKTEDIGNTMTEIYITNNNNTWGYEIPKEQTAPTTDKAAEKKDSTLPNPTPASQAPKNDTSSKDAFVQSLHDSGH